MSETLRLGAAYYPEQDPESEWALDARLMRDLGLDCVRIGEFCWSRMQRSDGAHTLDWLQRAVELLDGFGIKTILCTPTATPPAWLTDRYPDLSPVTADGRVGRFGGRRHYSVFHADYRDRCAQLADALGERFGHHPAVIGWQVDNEVGSYYTVDCSPPALAAFHGWLERKYGTVDELNRRWGLIFWNQEVERFDQVPAPVEMMCTRSPQLVLDYNRFCLEGMADFLLAQAGALRRRIAPRQFVVACAVDTVMHTLYRLQTERKMALVDAVTLHNYPELMPQPGHVALHLDFFRSLSPARSYLCLEHQLGSGYTTTGGINPDVRRYWSLETLAHGGRAILWFHWKRFRTGPEWRHPAVVERDRKPREPFRGLQAIVRDMRRIEPYLAGARVVADAQILFSLDNALARDRASEPIFWMQIQLPDAHRHRLPMWVAETLRAVYNPLRRFGWTLDLVSESDAWDPAKPLFVPDLDLVTPALADKLTAFARAGGVVIVFPGAGERDEDGAEREAPPPGLLADFFGVELADYYPLEPDGGSAFDHQAGRAQEPAGVDPNRTVTTVRVGDHDFAFDVRHGEVLSLRGADPLGVYTEGLYRGRPALACRRHAKGRAIYLGAVPATTDAAEGFYRAILTDPAPGVYPCARVAWTSPQGTFAFLLNGRPSPCALPNEIRDLITDRPMRDLPAFGVALVRTA